MRIKRACGVYQPISKQTVKALTTPSILDEVNESDWSVTSFDPTSREVCVDLKNKYHVIHLTFTLPSF